MRSKTKRCSKHSTSCFCQLGGITLNAKIAPLFVCLFFFPSHFTQCDFLRKVLYHCNALHWDIGFSSKPILGNEITRLLLGSPDSLLWLDELGLAPWHRHRVTIPSIHQTTQLYHSGKIALCNIQSVHAALKIVISTLYEEKNHWHHGLPSI